MMLNGLLEQPSEFVGHIRRYTNSLTTQMVFGFRTLSINDPNLLQLFHVSISRFSKERSDIARDSSNSVRRQEPALPLF